MKHRLGLIAAAEAYERASTTASAIYLRTGEFKDWNVYSRLRDRAAYLRMLAQPDPEVDPLFEDAR